MSRVNDIIENHEHLEKLNAILKHYSVNAEFITAKLINNFNEEEGNDQYQDLIEDLKRFYEGAF